MRASLHLCILPLLLAAGLARASDDEGLRLSASAAWQHDDNLLRVPDADPGFGGQRGDSWRALDAGAAFDHRYGRQRVQASARLSQVAFDRFRQLDYHGKDGQAIWYWQLGDSFSGKAGASHVQLLAPYTDLRTSARNLRVQRAAFLDGAWRLHPRWRATLGWRTDRYDYELLFQRANARRERALAAGIDYVAPSGSYVGIEARRLDARYPFRRPFALLTDDFNQDECRLRASWLASGKSTLDLLAGWTARRQPAFGPGRASGLTGRVSGTWAATGKIGASAAVWRDFAPIESTRVSYTLNKGASVNATWDVSARLRFEAGAMAERRDYGARRAVPGIGRLDDSLRSASLGATWQALPTVKLNLALAHQVRGGTPQLDIGAFRSNSVALHANITFR